MMKRLMSFLLVAVMMLTLVACGGEPADKTTPTTTPAPAIVNKLPELLAERNVPALKTRDEMLDILMTEVYGKLPPKLEDQYYPVLTEESYCAGKAVVKSMAVRGTLNGQNSGFTFKAVVPTTPGPHPFFVHIAFGESNVMTQQPTEEIIDNGYAILFFNYQKVASDDNDFTNGISEILYEDGVRPNGDDPGKISMWAWASHRLLDYAETEPDTFDMSRAFVCGHSRLGKTALWAAATDERFVGVYSNNSGCTGAALSSGKTGETVKRVLSLCSGWFCKNYKQYAGNEASMPFDQHYLLACVAPRKVLVGSASEDATADPLSEQLSCLAASDAFANGFVYTRVAEVGDEFYEGDIGYHLRKGTHYFSREDWQKAIKFFNMKFPKK